MQKVKEFTLAKHLCLLHPLTNFVWQAQATNNLLHTYAQLRQARVTERYDKRAPMNW